MARVELAGEPIVITGASSGIGRATALACARAGMPVVVCARREDRLASLVGEIEGAGGEATALRADVTDEAQCAAMVDTCIERYGSIYSVFANAGYGLERAVHLVTDRELRDIFEVNFFGTMNTVRAALPHLLKAGRGHVVICSSSIGKLGVPYAGAYCATKGAQSLIGQAMRCELKGRGVRVSTVHPIGTKTEFFETAGERSGVDKAYDGHSPRFFMQSADTVAGSVVRALRTGRPEVWPTFAVFVRMSIALANAFPRLGDWGMRNIKRSDKDGTDA